MANIKEMAEAHLKNVQKQIQDLENTKTQIDTDIATLKAYLENGIAELNGSSNLVEQQSSPVAMELPTSNIFK
tara:strand:- start:536 stop:754 length:219 start_codon:yes stop_codon:yes gene_type:complete